jgi:hypothetical protein
VIEALAAGNNEGYGPGSGGQRLLAGVLRFDAFGSEVEAAARGNAGIAAARARRHQRHADVVGREFGAHVQAEDGQLHPEERDRFLGGRTRNTRRSSPPRRIEPLSQYPVVLRPSIDEPIFVDRGFAAVVGRNRKLQLGQAVDHTPPSQETSMIAVPHRSCRLVIDVLRVLRQAGTGT